jgi:hypothetical protein
MMVGKPTSFGEDPTTKYIIVFFESPTIFNCVIWRFLAICRPYNNVYHFALLFKEIPKFKENKTSLIPPGPKNTRSPPPHPHLPPQGATKSY